MGLFDNDLIKDSDYKMYMNILRKLENLEDPVDLEDLQNELRVHKEALVNRFGKGYLEQRKII